SFGDAQWFKVFDPTTATVVLPVHAAAPRAASETWRLQYGIGPQPEPSGWTDLASGTGSTTVRIGPAQLTRIAAQTRPASGPAGPAVTLRRVVTDPRGLVAMDRRTEYLVHDPTLLGHAAIHPGGSVDAPPTLAPIGPGGANALIVASADGLVHAYEIHGSDPTLHDLPGWPVATAPYATHLGEHAYTSGEVTSIPRASILGGVAVGDLAGTGQLSIVAADMSGRVYAWDGGGHLLPHFPLASNPRFSGPDARDQHNRLLPAFFAAPALAHLENDRELDIVASSEDRHAYAWRPDGTAVPGFPVLVVDRSQVTAIDPVTNRVTFRPDARAGQGAKIVDTPAIGALGGSGRPDLVVDTNEEYAGTINASVANPVTWAIGQVPLLNPANSRVYALDAHGKVRPGWPVPIGDLDAELLPDVGDGAVASPALASLDGGPALEVGVMTTVGPAYVLKPDGSSFLGTGPDGKPITLSIMGASRSSAQAPSLPALGAPVFAPLGGLAPGVSLIAPASSVGKALDAVLPDNQILHDNQLDAWNTRTGTM